eukprot:TRINITY_DN16167_c0_g1_i2.p1 TRINITY_DN16167_c0_g1~~TRINITY_DN16167_c0_g1_i2.p1  ORF type:complete len:790 (+),score=94.36 TRINITY_DN16167_c0_g1_i2:159-2528(+)
MRTVREAWRDLSQQDKLGYVPSSAAGPAEEAVGLPDAEGDRALLHEGVGDADADKDDPSEADAGAESADDGAVAAVGDPAPPARHRGFSELTKNTKTYRQRVASLRAAVSKLASGREGIEPRLDDQRSLLAASLSADVKQELVKDVPLSNEDKTFANLGRHLSDQLVSAWSRKRTFPGVALCVSLRAVGFKYYKDIRKQLGIDISASAWHDSEGIEAAPTRTDVSNGRLGFRKMPIDDMRAVLQKNSTDTCTVVSISGRGRKRPASALEDKVIKRALVDSKRQLWQGIESENKISLSSWYRNAKKDLPMYCTTKRKLDVCEKCEQWDRLVEHKGTLAISQWKQEIAEIMPSYWNCFEADIYPKLPASAKQGLSVQLVASIRRYIDKHPEQFKAERDKLKAKTWKALRAVEERIRKEIANSWPAMGGEIGLLRIVESWSWHFTVKDVQKDFYKQCVDHPEEGVAYYHIDYAQSKNLPVGPHEASTWWYANARSQVNVLGFLCWGKGFPKPHYVTLLSDVSNHDSHYTIAAFSKVFAMYPPAAGTKKHVLWCDVGKHFRSYTFASHWLVSLAKKWKVPMELHFFADGHGEGALDGGFGRMQQWTDIAARSNLISDIVQWVDLLGKRASAFSDSSECNVKFVHFEPPAKRTIKDKPLDGPAIGILCSKTFSLTSTVNALGHVTIRNHVLAGLPAVRSCAPRFTAAPEVHPDDKEDVESKVCADGWRRLVRKLEPEKAPAKLHKMFTAFDPKLVESLKVPLHYRRRSLAEKAEASARTSARAVKRRATYKKKG